MIARFLIVSIHVKYALTLLVLFTSLNLSGQNKADRYLKAYQQYLDASCPIKESGIKHFVFFARNREKIIDHPFLEIPRFKGAQVMYAWQQLEPAPGQYDFSLIQEDYDYLAAKGKKLFIQLQDATFSTAYKGVPNYLLTKEYAGGAVPQRSDAGKQEGWVAKRWHPKVQARFALLLEALGKAFDGKIEGINLQETAISVSKKDDPSFSEVLYVEAIKRNMNALKKAFRRSTTLQYANFIPGEWLPYNDKGYLKAVYAYGQEIGVGLGGPDLMVRRKGQLNHLIALMHEGEFTVPLAIAIQDGNYIGQTGADDDYDESKDEGRAGRTNLVPLLHAFAKDFLNVNYMFWSNQKPYFSEDVIPCFSSD
ncbi:MAG: hypothetical protein ACFB0B_09660 [Thermonemataceae bacterium]